MEYKFKDEIKSAFTESFLRKNNTDELWDMQNELDEVYAKAEAYDEIEKIYLDENTNRMEKYFGVVGILNEGSEQGESL